jgi:ABC-type phosphate/phosphonate transport system ATPase subunit
MAGVDIRAVHKHFGSTHVIRGVDIAIADGEFCVLVGPSGLREVDAVADDRRGSRRSAPAKSRSARRS